MKQLIIITAFLLITGCTHVRGVASPAADQSKSQDLVFSEQIVKDLCDKKVALLGEASHGDGETLKFKSILVRRLIEECHFNAVFFESGIYDFLEIERKLKSGKSISESIISSAIGGIWATQELKDLLPYLLEKTNSSIVSLGGIDDQIGQGTYAQSEIPNVLSEYLHGYRKSQCISELKRYTQWQYSESFPYSMKTNSVVLGCLRSVKKAISKIDKDLPIREIHAQMATSLIRYFERDSKQFLPNPYNQVQIFNDRDHSMFLNFKWLTSRLSAGSKAIVWTATAHAAKSLFNGKVPFGKYVKEGYSDHAFTLGFSAYSGTYGMVHQVVQELPVALDDSIEGIAFSSHIVEARYFNLKQIPSFGEILARPLNYTFIKAQWSEILDGLLVFREEHPPHFLDQ